MERIEVSNGEVVVVRELGLPGIRIVWPGRGLGQMGDNDLATIYSREKKWQGRDAVLARASREAGEILDLRRGLAMEIKQGW